MVWLVVVWRAVVAVCVSDCAQISCQAVGVMVVAGSWMVSHLAGLVPLVQSPLQV